MPNPWRLVAAGAAVLSLAGAVACSIVLTDSASTQCKTDGDCASRFPALPRCVSSVCVAPQAVADAATDGEAGAVDPAFGCLGKVRWVTPDLSAKVTLNYQFVRLIGEAPITDLEIVACQRIDPECRGAAPDSGVRTDSNGRAAVVVPKGFEGFLKLDPPASFSNMMPSLYFVLPPPETDLLPDSGLGKEAVHLTSAQDVDFIVTLAGKPKVDPTLGHIFGIALDCEGKPTSGVALKVSRTDPKTFQYYTDSTGNPTTEVSETSHRGEAGFINLPEGPVTLEATVPALGKRLGSYSLLVRAGHVTYVAFPPSP